MRIEILGTESLGVRGLCCAVTTRKRHIVIDPGLALGYRRNGLLPHPRQVATGVAAARCIVRHLAMATDVIFSHYHGDHVPLADANPYQLPLAEVAPFLKQPVLWGKDPVDAPSKFADRCRDLEAAAGKPIIPCDGRKVDGILFSDPMPHGLREAGMGSVIMTRIAEDGQVFVHASDIQLLDDAPVSVILDWSPDTLLLSGPPLYRDLPAGLGEAARQRALRLARAVPCCIIDHHLLRSRAGLRWLEGLRAVTGKSLPCAADYMQVEPRLLEADRLWLYESEPVAPGWHNAYVRPALVPKRRDETTRS